MNAEALVGTVLGTCTLQQLIGQGGMGAVYLAQQSRPRRQVAVKVLLPTTPLKPHHLAAFLERFRRETDAAASLEHPNIIPVYEYDEQNGLAYLVMPYISGGTLRDVMEREGQLLLPKVVNYLEQLADALDFAHVRGVIHRDIKPANILLTPEGRLLLTDFGLVKIVSEEGMAQVRLTGAGAPVGTPDYMSPEQVMGEEVDGRADLYSLGIILFQMLTATTPFQGETPMQIAAQQLHAQPPLPRRFRPELPDEAQQVVLKSLSKRPVDRYSSGLELATAFRLALSSLDAQATMFASGSLGGSSLSSRSGLFDPKWRNSALMPAVNIPGNAVPGGMGSMTGRAATGSMPVAGMTGMTGMTGTAGMPTATGTAGTAGAPGRSKGLLSRTGMFPRVGVGGAEVFPQVGLDGRGPSTPHSGLSASTGTQPVPPLPFHAPQAAPAAFQPGYGEYPGYPSSSPFAQSGISQLSPSMSTTTGALAVPQSIKLTGPVKVVQMATTDGKYVTGLLPVPNIAIPVSPHPGQTSASRRNMFMALLLIVLILGGSLGVWLVRTHSGANTASQKGATISGTPNLQATTAAQMTATAQANVILSDSLSSNIRDLPVGTSPTRSFAFQNGAYDVTNLGKEGVAVVVPYTLPNEPQAFQLTMQEIKGDDTSSVNSFGLIFRYTQQTKGSQPVSTFYSFEVVNTTGSDGKYWFYKYDSSSSNPWTPIWSQAVGKEFKEGHGANIINTFKVLENGSSFSFVVNGTLITSKPIVDKSYPGGDVGMLVNLDGTEIAFSNLKIVKLP